MTGAFILEKFIQNMVVWHCEGLQTGDAEQTKALLVTGRVPSRVSWVPGARSGH